MPVENQTTEIIDRLKHIIAEQLDVNLTLEEIQPDVPLFEGGLGLDSVAIMELITLIEENFDFQFLDEELTLKPFKNLHVLTDFILSKMQASHS